MNYDTFDIDELNLDDLQIDPQDNDDSNEQYQNFNNPKYSSSQHNQTYNNKKRQTNNYHSFKKHESRIQQQIPFDKASINLRGLKLLIKMNQNDQLLKLIQKLRQSQHQVVIASQPLQQIKLNQDSNLKKQKFQDQQFLSPLKIQQIQQPTCFFQTQTTQQLSNQTKVIILISNEMRNNYNNYGRIIYYNNLMNQYSQDLNISQICIDCNINIGIIYGFTQELNIVIFAIYNILVSKEENNYLHLLIMAFIRANAGENSKKYQDITFHIKNIIDIEKLEYLTNQYRREAERNGLSIPKYHFVIDPIYIEQTYFLENQEGEQKKYIGNILMKLVQTQSNKQFNLLKNRLFSYILQSNLSDSLLSNGYTILQFTQSFMQNSIYTCRSQIKTLVGVSQLYFKNHKNHRNYLIKQMIQELLNQCAEVYSNILQIYQDYPVTSPILIYLSNGVINNLVKQHTIYNKKQVSHNFNRLNQQKMPLFETQIPELSYIKQQTSKLIYDYLLKQLIQCSLWQIPNKKIQQQIHYFQLQLQQQDQLFFQQYQPLSIYIHYIGNKQQYYQIKTQKNKWICQCGYNILYGIPCKHQIKICLLSYTLLKNQIQASFLHEEYYQRCIAEKVELIAKIDALKRKDQIILMPLATECGRQELVNFRTKHRMVGKGDYL